MISIELANVPVKSALDEVAKTASFNWSYNPRILPEKQISISAKNRPVREVLTGILGEEFSFKENGNYVILKKQKKPENLLSGYISDPKTGRGVANMAVYNEKTLHAVSTDSCGYVELKMKRPAPIVLTKIGYTEQTQVQNLRRRKGQRRLGQLMTPG